MSWGFLIELLCKSSLCAGTTLLALAILRRRSAAERSRVAHAGLLATLLLPVSLIVSPAWDVETPEAFAAVFVIEDAGPDRAAAPAPAASGEAPVALSAAAESAARGFSLSSLFLLPTALLLGLMILAVGRLRLLRSRSRVLLDPVWLAALAAMRRRFGVKRATALLVSRELASPISWGLVTPVILLDEQAATRSRDAEAIIAHELAHVSRLDWAKLLTGRLATALFWFNPLVWVLAARCHELREEAVDDLVLQTSVSSADYAELLIDSARHENRAVLAAANGVAPRNGSLRRRVMRILDPSKSRAPARLRWTLACCVGALLLNVPLAAVSLVGATDEAGLSGEQAAAAILFGRAAADPGESPVPVASSLTAQALVAAATQGDREALDALLATGVDPNAEVKGDGTALIAAARSGRRDIVELLLARGADIDQPVSGDANPLIAAAAAGHLETVRLLLDRGADIEFVVPTDENALMQASRWGHEPVVRLLLDRGADVNSHVGSRTPLIMARQGRHREIEGLLLQAGAVR